LHYIFNTKNLIKFTILLNCSEILIFNSRPAKNAKVVGDKDKKTRLKRALRINKHIQNCTFFIPHMPALNCLFVLIQINWPNTQNPGLEKNRLLVSILYKTKKYMQTELSTVRKVKFLRKISPRTSRVIPLCGILRGST